MPQHPPQSTRFIPDMLWAPSELFSKLDAPPCGEVSLTRDEVVRFKFSWTSGSERVCMRGSKPMRRALRIWYVPRLHKLQHQSYHTDNMSEQIRLLPPSKACPLIA